MESDDTSRFLCSVIALYDFRRKARKKDIIYNRVLDWFSTIKCPPDKLGLGGKGFSPKVLDFGKQQKMLAAKGFDILTDFEVYSVGPAYSDKTQGYQAAACFSFDDAVYSYIVVNKRIVSLSELHQGLINDLVTLLLPSYGIGYYRPFHQGPGYYAIGLSKGLSLSGEGYEEALRISRWGDIGLEKKVYNKGCLRDVYPLNYLSQSQLGIEVEGLELREWIRREPKRGKLIPLVDEIMLWELEDCELNIIQSILQKNQAIFDPDMWMN